MPGRSQAWQASASGQECSRIMGPRGMMGFMRPDPDDGPVLPAQSAEEAGIGWDEAPEPAADQTAPGGRPGVTRRATVVFAALAAADTLLAAAGHERGRWLTKPLLMPALMMGRDRPAQRAIALGGAGDVALLGSTETAFTLGLACFLAGHVAWIIALRERPGGGLLRAKPALAVPQVAALDSGSPRTAAGGALFVASDTLLALEKFGDLHLPAHEALVMATYTSAQALLAG